MHAGMRALPALRSWLQAIAIRYKLAGCRISVLLTLCNRQVRSGVNRLVVDAYFVVDVRACGATRRADLANHVAARDVLPHLDIYVREMAVARRQSVAVIYDDDLAVTALASGEGDDAVGCGDDSRAVVCGDVLSGMKFRTIASERIAAVAEPISQSAFHSR